MIAKLKRAQSIAYQNKDQHRTCVLKAESVKLDIKRHEYVILFISLQADSQIKLAKTYKHNRLDETSIVDRH